jgi:hypothetical protein
MALQRCAIYRQEAAADDVSQEESTKIRHECFQERMAPMAGLDDYHPYVPGATIWSKK